MILKKKILLFGPIGDFGGRDIEVNIIGNAICDQYDVAIFSSIYITDNSSAVTGLKNVGFNSFEKEIYKTNLILRGLSLFFYLKNRKNKLAYAYVKNVISSLFFDFEKARKKILLNQIQEADAIIACVQLTSMYLKEAIEIAHELNKPFLVRTTGTINEFEVNSFQFLKKATCFIHHSESNADNLNKQIPLPYIIIDQCAQFEQKLLALPINECNIVYGYLGRLSEEKGILELLSFFNKTNHVKLLIAGDGPLKSEVLLAVNQLENIEYLGQSLPEDLDIFFKKIDILIIPSNEESGPLVGLEAMASAKVILSTKVGAMEERLSPTLNNFWFDNTNEQSFLDNLSQLKNLNKETYNQIAKSNRERYLDEYQFTSIKNKYNGCLTKYLNL